MSSQYSMKSYMKGALLLTVAAFVVKLLSAMYRVPYQNLVGDQGFYVYQQVYPFVAIFIVWTSSGLAVAISKMLAEAREEDERLAMKKTMFSFLMLLSTVQFTLLFFGAHIFANIMGDIRLAPLLQVGAFVVWTIPFLAILKGDLQAKGYMAPIAYAQMLEQTLRVAIILVGSFVVMHMFHSVYIAGEIAILGAVIGELFAVFVLIYYVRKSAFSFLLHVAPLWQWRVVKEVFLYSISVSMSSLLLIAFQFVDSFTVLASLVKLGMGSQEAMIVKGIYDRGQPLVQLGITFATTLAMAIVPVIAFKAKRGAKEAVPFIQLTYRATLLLSVAASVGLILVMPYANVLLFETNRLSDVLMLYVLSIVPLSIILTMTAVLQGFSKLLVPFILLASAVGIKVLSNPFLLGEFGVLGAALANNVAFFVSAFLLVMYLKRLKKIKLANLLFYSKLLFATLCMVFFVMFSEWVVTSIFGEATTRMMASFYSIVFVIIGAVTFMFVVAKIQLLYVREWFVIPLGRRMAMLQLWLNREK